MRYLNALRAAVPLFLFAGQVQAQSPLPGTDEAPASAPAADAVANAQVSSVAPILKSYKGTKIKGVRALTEAEKAMDVSELEKKSLNLMLNTWASGQTAQSMAPGTYLVSLTCGVGGFGLSFRKVVTLEAGYEYELECIGSTAHQGRVKVSRDEIVGSSAMEAAK